MWSSIETGVEKVKIVRGRSSQSPQSVEDPSQKRQSIGDLNQKRQSARDPGLDHQTIEEIDLEEPRGDPDTKVQEPKGKDLEV